MVDLLIPNPFVISKKSLQSLNIKFFKYKFFKIRTFASRQDIAYFFLFFLHYCFILLNDWFSFSITFALSALSFNSSLSYSSPSTNDIINSCFTSPLVFYFFFVLFFFWPLRTYKQKLNLMKTFLRKDKINTSTFVSLSLCDLIWCVTTSNQNLILFHSLTTYDIKLKSNSKETKSQTELPNNE